MSCLDLKEKNLPVTNSRRRILLTTVRRQVPRHEAATTAEEQATAVAQVVAAVGPHQPVSRCSSRSTLDPGSGRQIPAVRHDTGV